MGMSIKVNVSWRLQYLTNGQAVVETEGRTVGECLRNLPGMLDMLCIEQEEIMGPYRVYIKSSNAYTAELGKPVQENDELTIRPFLIGG